MAKRISSIQREIRQKISFEYLFFAAQNSPDPASSINSVIIKTSKYRAGSLSVERFAGEVKLD